MVFDQIGTPGTYLLTTRPGPLPSQHFTDPGFEGYSCMVLEDFTVVAGQVTINLVSALFLAHSGAANFAAVDGYAVNIFSDPALAGASLAGDVASVFVPRDEVAGLDLLTDGNGFEYGVVSLRMRLSLPGPGSYWLGVSPVAAIGVAGQFDLLANGATGPAAGGNDNSRFANPGAAFGVGTLVAGEGNFAYAISAVPEPGVALLGTAGCLCLLASGRWRRSGKQERAT